MTTFNKATAAEAAPSNSSQDKAFYVSAGFSLPARSGKWLVLTFNASVTLSDKATS